MLAKPHYARGGVTYNEQDTKRYCVGAPCWGLSLGTKKSLANVCPIWA